MTAKLALRNVKRQLSSYTIFFITVVFAIALMFAINNILFAPELWERTGLPEDRYFELAFTGLLIIAISIVTIAVAFTICYASAFLLKKRKKELGIYVLTGFSRGKIIKIFLLEQALISGISFLLGLALGVGVFYIFNVLIVSIIGNNMPMMSLNVLAFLPTVLQWLGIFLASSIYISIVLGKSKIAGLISTKDVDKKKPKFPILERIGAILFSLLAVASIAVGFWIFAEMENVFQRAHADRIFEWDFHTTAIIIILAVAAIVFIFLFHVFLRGIYTSKLNRSDKKPKHKKYNGCNIFHYRQAAKSLNTNSVMMGIIAVLLSISLIFSTTTFTSRFTQVEQINSFFPFDVVGFWDYEEDNHDVLRNPDRVVEEAKRHAKVSFYHTFLSFQQYPEPKDGLRFDVIRQSDVQAILRGLNLYENYYAVGEEEFIILYRVMNSFREAPSEYTVFNAIDIGDTLEMFEEELTFIGANNEGGRMVVFHGVRSLNSNNMFPIGNNSWSMTWINGYMVVCDSVIDNFENNLIAVKEGVFLNTVGHLPAAFMQPFLYNSIFGVSSRDFSIDQLNVEYSFIIISALFAGLSFMFIAMALLSLKIMSDIDGDKKRYSILNMLGVSDSGRRKILLKQILTFFSAPMLFPLLMIIPSLLIGIATSTTILGFIHGGVIAIALVVPLIYAAVFGSYFAATYYLSVKNNITPIAKPKIELLEIS